MRESDTEGVATRSGPESCVGVCEGVGEALTGVRAGWAIEPRNQRFVGADVVVVGGRQYRWPRYREWPADPARSKNLRMHGVSARENREVPWSPAVVDDAPPIVVRGVAYRPRSRAARGTLRR
jgi:RNA-directed DNA polymerase